MRRGARRPVSRLFCGFMRRAWLLLWVLLAANAAQAEIKQHTIVGAKYGEPTDRYDHGILGDAVEWGALVLTVAPCTGCTGNVGRGRRHVTIRLPQNRVFEDVEPRIIDAGQGRIVVMVVETDLSLGARLALYDTGGLISATPFIGRTHRWLAPIGAGDFDGDGFVEIAYIDRPHLAKMLRIWRIEYGKLIHVSDTGGFTNHRIGDRTIAGGLRDCGTGLEMIVADARWRRIMAVTFDGKTTRARAVGVVSDGFSAALECTK